MTLFINGIHHTTRFVHWGVLCVAVYCTMHWGAIYNKWLTNRYFSVLAVW